MLTSIANACDTLNRWVGHVVSWLSIGMVGLMAITVIMRYFFASGSPWQTELVLFMHAAAFLAAMGFTLQAGEQVRVDVFYSRFTPKRKALVDLLGIIFLLFPLCLSIIYFSYGFVASSWELKEASSEFGGMPGFYLLKSFLIIGPALLMLQGVGCASRAILTLKGAGSDG